MRILWISSLAWKYETGYRNEVNGAGAVSGSMFQQSMIEGLEELGHRVDIVCDYPYKPGGKVHSEFNWNHNNNSEDITVKTISIPYISLLYKEFSIIRAVKEKNRKNEYDVAIAYLIHQPYMKALSVIKRINSNVRTVLICPDLPDMMDMSLDKKLLKKYLKKIDAHRITKLYKSIDGFVLFAEKMRERIDINKKPYAVIEGVATIDELNLEPVKKKKYVLHAGTLHKNIGIEQIIEAFEYIKHTDISLKIYGTGELEGYIIEKANSNPRIQFGGFVDRNKLFAKQKEALVLINARNPKDDFTKYSFPSKTFEYLYSGTPFITTKLDGVPKEFGPYLFEIEDNNPTTIANKIDEIYDNYEECLVKALRARDFIKEEKGKVKQARKLVNFVLQLKGD